MGGESREKSNALEKEAGGVSTADLLQLLNDAENNPDNDGYEFRMQLASMVLIGLRDKGWTQTQLAEAADMEPPKITKIVHGDSNVTFRTAWRVLKALGIKARLTDESVPEVFSSTTSPHVQTFEVSTDGEDIISAHTISGTTFRVRSIVSGQSARGKLSDRAKSAQS